MDGLLAFLSRWHVVIEITGGVLVLLLLVKINSSIVAGIEILGPLLQDRRVCPHDTCTERAHCGMRKDSLGYRLAMDRWETSQSRQ